MNIFLVLMFFFSLALYVDSRDFYLGMFRRNDFLVAQDVIYKEAAHFGYATASYGRVFKCPVSYINSTYSTNYCIDL